MGDQSHESFELIRRHRSGDPEALGVLVRRYLPAIERIVRVRMGAALMAVTTVADVVQDTLVRVVKDIHRYEPQGDARWIAWVAQLAQREVQNQARAQRTQKRSAAIPGGPGRCGESAIEQAPDTATGVSSVAEKQELRGLLDSRVAELPGAQREVFLLRHYAIADWPMVAERMGRSVEACQELERRARMSLVKQMRAQG